MTMDGLFSLYSYKIIFVWIHHKYSFDSALDSSDTADKTGKALNAYAKGNAYGKPTHRPYSV